MGEAFVNSLKRGDIRAFSAGISQGAGVLPNVVAAMQEIGISMEGHYSKLLTPEMLEDADIIVATCDEVCVAIPEEIARVKRVEKWHLPAPVGPIEEVRIIRDEIKSRVEKLIRYVKKAKSE
jgi:protein-tyrosine-phosphatase